MDRISELEIQLEQEREKVRRRTEECNEISRLYVDSQTQLSQLQALVRALPMPEEGGFLIVEADGDYYVNHTSRFSTKDEAEAYARLLAYRAALDATTPARGQELEDK